MDSTADPSYPHIFRRHESDHEPDCEPYRKAGPEIPVVDLRALDPGRLAEACRVWGIFRLANHGIPPTLSNRILDRARLILSEPFEDKRTRFGGGPVSYFWGTPAVGKRVRSVNWVEGLHIPLARLRSGEEPGFGSSSFRCLVDEYVRHMARIARELFNALTVDLKLDSVQSTSHFSEPDAILRVYRYPRRPNACHNFGLEAHSDSSLLSILNQDEVGGLQILREGRWINVAPISDMLIVNIGDMMQAISDNEYMSVEHRVLASSSKERISLCYFAYPSEDGLISSSRYKPFTYKDFKAKVQEDIEATGFKIGLDRFRITDPN
uniref:GA2ox4 n=1 Tax=Paris polyphylla var. yunnanensis TaxID=221260 RepID=A0A2P1NRF4_PARPY|nr:GA2ox4 [Paris polyphylla var. yunnanensis]